MAEKLLPHAQGRAFIADTAYDADRIVAAVRAQGMKPVICNHPLASSIDAGSTERSTYLVEVCFHNLKRFRAIATRYEKTAQNYLGLVQLACVWLWLS